MLNTFNKTVHQIANNLGEYFCDGVRHEMKTYLELRIHITGQGIPKMYTQAKALQKTFHLPMQQAAAVALAYNLYVL